LYQYIKSTTADIPSEIILGWARDIASGMNMVHLNRIVHRDLKTFHFFFFLVEKLIESINQKQAKYPS